MRRRSELMANDRVRRIKASAVSCAAALAVLYVASYALLSRAGFRTADEPPQRAAHKEHRREHVDCGLAVHGGETGTSDTGYAKPRAGYNETFWFQTCRFKPRETLSS